MTLQTTPVHSSPYASKLLQTLVLGSAIVAGGMSNRAFAQESNHPKPLDNQTVATQKEEVPSQVKETIPRSILHVIGLASGAAHTYLIHQKRKNKT